MKTKRAIFLLFLSLSLARAAYANVSPDMCRVDTCPAGTDAITYADKQDPYYVCPDRDKEEYISTVFGFFAVSAAVGTFPNISDKTGEPEYEGDSKALLDMLRNKAQVSSVDEAIAACAPGKSGRKVRVLNVPKDTLAAVYVLDKKANLTYWAPIFALNKQQQRSVP